MTYQKFIESDDWAWLLEHDLTIRQTWNQPPGSWEYMLLLMGGDSAKDVVCTRKSQRACLNYAKRNIDVIDKMPRRVIVVKDDTTD